MSALDLTGATAHFTGANSITVAGAREAPGVVVAGNLLASESVLDACLEGFLTGKGGLDERLLTALETAPRAGGDSRGLLSAALPLLTSGAREGKWPAEEEARSCCWLTLADP